MLDSNYTPDHWGIMPILFHIGGFAVPAYSFFIMLGLITGILYYFHEAKKTKVNSERTLFIAAAAIIGGIIGAKIPIWIMYFPQLSQMTLAADLFSSGRTIVGGLIGGFVAVKLTKKYLKINDKRGNLFAPAIALGLSIGRIGCFLQGCCYGIATNLPWGVNFGDGIRRHPTQIYEAGFNLIMFFYLNHLKSKNPRPGKLLQIYFVDYFIFRFFLEFIKFEPKMIWYLTIYQIIAIIALVYLLREPIYSYARNKFKNKN